MSIHSQRRSWGVAALVLVALMAAACSGGATSSPTATADTTQATSQAGTGTADACALLTTAEAQEALGVPMATAIPKEDLQVCDYVSADGRTDLAVARYDNVPDDKAGFDVAYGGQPVTGVGSYAKFNAALKALWAFQNGTVISISLSMADDSGVTAEQIQAALTKVALAALARL